MIIRVRIVARVVTDFAIRVGYRTFFRMRMRIISCLSVRTIIGIRMIVRFRIIRCHDMRIHMCLNISIRIIMDIYVLLTHVSVLVMIFVLRLDVHRLSLYTIGTMYVLVFVASPVCVSFAAFGFAILV